MNTKLMRTMLIALVSLVVLGSLLGILYVLDVITLADLKEHGVKIASVILIIAGASGTISALLSANNKS
jgi:hypothetical protein